MRCGWMWCGCGADVVRMWCGVDVMYADVVRMWCGCDVRGCGVVGKVEMRGW